MEIIRIALIAGVILCGVWFACEIYNVVRQLVWNWIDETAHPIKRSSALRKTLEVVGLSETDALTASIGVACFLAAWPISWIGLVLRTLLYRARKNRRFEKLNAPPVVSAAALAFERPIMITPDLREVGSEQVLKASM